MEILYFLINYYEGHTSVESFPSMEELNEALAEKKGLIRVKVISGYLLEDRS